MPIDLTKEPWVVTVSDPCGTPAQISSKLKATVARRIFSPAAGGRNYHHVASCRTMHGVIRTMQKEGTMHGKNVGDGLSNIRARDPPRGDGTRRPRWAGQGHGARDNAARRPR
jgi:hypothetical protein